MPRIACVGVVINRQRKVLLVTNRTFGGWSLPGGKVEGLETPGKCLRREFAEEVDLQVITSRLLGSWPGTIVPDFLVRVYHVLMVAGKARALEDNSAIRWTTFRNLGMDPVFGDFYKDHFPEGFDHLAVTRGITRG